MKKTDRFLLFFVLALAAGIYLFNEFVLYRSKSNELIAVISANNEVIRRINLSKVTEEEHFIINQGNYENEIIVEPGRIRMGYANCPEPESFHQNWISKPHEILVCLPNFVIIEIEGSESTIDGVTY